ncbi:MAG: hypothetical protein LBJ80_00070 [Rickettsiales bacterium]|jgi:hypothetical protein|nr:hypothetical protein [Rickettsiales bacterium]
MQGNIVEIRPYSIYDAFSFDFKDQDELCDLLNEDIHYFHKIQNGYTLYVKGEKVAIWYHVPVRKDVADIALFMSNKVFNTDLRVVLKVARDVVQILNGKYFRLQAAVKDSKPKNKRFIEHLGFTKEGTLRAFGPNRQTCIFYSKLRSDL